MSVTFRKGKAEDWKIVYDLICDMEGTSSPRRLSAEFMTKKWMIPGFTACSPKKTGRCWAC